MLPVTVRRMMLPLAHRSEPGCRRVVVADAGVEGEGGALAEEVAGAGLAAAEAGSDSESPRDRHFKLKLPAQVQVEEAEY